MIERPLPFPEAPTEKIIDLLSRADRWVILCHTKPDGDTLGTGSAFWSMGRSLGKKTQWGGPDPLSPKYLFLPGAEEYRPSLSMASLGLSSRDAVVVLDTATTDRSVEDLALIPEGVPVINMDHHKDNERFGTTFWIDPPSSSVGEMGWVLFQNWGVPIGQETAEGLYTAIVTDCGNFAFSNTTPRTHRAAGHLLSLGVSPEKTDRLLKFNRTVGGLRLQGRVLERVKIFHEFAAITWIEKKDFGETGSRPEDTEFFVNDLLTIQSVSFAALLTEDKGEIRASLRSRGEVSAAEIARAFGGGGHPQAAGCKLPTPLERGLADLIELLEKKNGALRSNSSK